LLGICSNMVENKIYNRVPPSIRSLNAWSIGFSCCEFFIDMIDHAAEPFFANSMILRQPFIRSPNVRIFNYEVSEITSPVDTVLFGYMAVIGIHDVCTRTSTLFMSAGEILHLSESFQNPSPYTHFISIEPLSVSHQIRCSDP
jgi:hypothetical protein